jgi:hypothetical protein
LHFLNSRLFFGFVPPMKEPENAMSMQITITISDDFIREAQARGLSVQEFVESLIDKGLSVSQEKPVMSTAIERIRALRSTGPGR